MLNKNKNLLTINRSLLETGASHAFISPCDSLSPSLNIPQYIQSDKETVSFLGWYHAKNSGRLLKTSLTHIVPKNQRDFCRQFG